MGLLTINHQMLGGKCTMFRKHVLKKDVFDRFLLDE
jgi:hypothetical protein